MSAATGEFGPDFILGGLLQFPDLNFRFEVWSKWTPLAHEIIREVYLEWRRASPANIPQQDRTVRIQWWGSLMK